MTDNSKLDLMAVYLNGIDNPIWVYYRVIEKEWADF